MPTKICHFYGIILELDLLLNDREKIIKGVLSINILFIFLKLLFFSQIPPIKLPTG